MNVLLLTALSLVAGPVHGRHVPRLGLVAPDLRYRCTPERKQAWMPAARLAPALATDDGTIDLKQLALSYVDDRAPRLGRYVRGRTVLLPLVSRTAAGETALGATFEVQAP